MSFNVNEDEYMERMLPFMSPENKEKYLKQKAQRDAMRSELESLLRETGRNGFMPTTPNKGE